MRVPLRVPICCIYAGLSLPLLRACRPESGSVGVKSGVKDRCQIGGELPDFSIGVVGCVSTLRLPYNFQTEQLVGPL